MGVRSFVVGLVLVAAACRDPNPYFEEPPFPTSTGSDGSSSATPTTSTTSPTTDLTSTSISSSSTGGSISASATDTGMITTGTTMAPFCMAGETQCDGLTANVCDGNGGFLSSEDCGTLCVAGLGCADCMPGTGQCVGDLAQACNAMGVWADSENCDPIQGLTCNPAAGACDGACAAAAIGTSHLGCDFYAATLASFHNSDPPWFGNFAVVIVNPGVDIANISIEYGDMAIPGLPPVFGGTAHAVDLAYNDALVQPGPSNTGPSQHAVDGAYRIRSDQPIAVYQFEPIVAQDSGDASLLHPVHTWGSEHVVASRAHFVSFIDYSFPGFYAVIASQDDTTVTVTPSAAVGGVYAGGGVDATGNGVVVLDAGDVLEVLSSNVGMPMDSDLTGSRIVADKPVAVFGGHKCGEAPTDGLYCDHLEESMPPISALGTDYVVAAPFDQAMEILPTLVRVIATEDDTNLVYDPIVPGGLTNLANAGDFTELNTFDEGRITADKKILVVQYISSFNQFGIDPSQVVSVPSAQFLQSYRVFAGNGYADVGATLVAPSGTAVTRDGMPVVGWTPIGATGYGVTRVVLGGADDGSYLFEADAPFGVAVHGYGPGTSYWVTGGQALGAL